MKIQIILKRLFDILASLLLLILLFPVMAGIAAFIRVKSPGAPAIFRQKRPGYHCKPFTLYKFRSMTNERDEFGHLLPDEKRLKRWGLLLRRYSLDELPQFYNVLRGDMSIIGPRPLLMQYIPLYSPQQMQRHNMRPGITGLTAVLGRNSLSWEERFDYDCRYVNHWSLWLDIKIAFLTVKTAFFEHKGIKGFEISVVYRGEKAGRTNKDQ